MPVIAPKHAHLIRLEILGIPIVVAAGSLLHFAFQWSGYFEPVAVIAAVNESVWEHLKLAFWPSLIWAVAVYFLARPQAKQYWPIKGVSLLLPSITITAVFYGYTALIGRNHLILDIGTFVLAVAAGYLIAIKLLKSEYNSRGLRLAGAALLFGQIGAFSTLTYFPPPYFLFEDGRSGTRGIPLHLR